MRAGGSFYSRQKIDHDAGALFAFVFLEEMTGTGDGDVRLALRAGDEFLEDALAAARYRIAIAEGSQERLLPLSKSVPGFAICGCGGIVRLRWHQQRKRARAGFVGFIGKRRVVSGDDFRRQFGLAGAFDDAAAVQLGDALRVSLPAEECFGQRNVAGGEAGVRADKAGESIGILGGDAQADETTPVLSIEGCAAEIEGTDERCNRVDVELIRVIVFVHRLVRTPEAEKIGGDDAIAGGGDRRNHFAIEVAPGWLAVHHQDGPGVSRSFIEVMHAAAGDFEIAGSEVVAGKIGETFVRRAESFHGRLNRFYLIAIRALAANYSPVASLAAMPAWLCARLRRQENRSLQARKLAKLQRQYSQR